MKRVTAMIAAASTAAFAATASAQLSPEQMSHFEQMAKLCGEYEAYLKERDRNVASVETDFLKSARNHGATSLQLEELRLEWTRGNTKAILANRSGSVPETAVADFKQFCRSIQ